MINFKISQEEKNRILEMHSPKKIISEQKQFLAKLCGGSVDDIFKMFSDDVVKNMDDVFARVFTKPINLVQKGSQQFLKSASGAEVPMKTVQDAIQLVAQGKLNASEIATYLPRQLADGSEFRSIIVNNLKKRGAQPSSAFASAGSKSTANLMSGTRVSNRWYLWKPENIDFTKFSNPKTTFDELNKNISSAIKTGNWNLVPRAGFEKFGITNFREFLQNNISKINEVDPSIGRWSVNFK